MLRAPRLLLTAAAAIAGLCLAGSAQAWNGGANTPITVGGGFDDPQVGIASLRWSQTPPPAYRTRFTVRGNVRLDAGRWCVTTSLLPGTARRVVKRKQVDLAAPATVTLPRFVRRPVGKLLWSDSRVIEAVRVRVLADGCAGLEQARGSITLGGGG